MAKSKKSFTTVYYSFLTLIAFLISTGYQFIKNTYDSDRIFEKSLIVLSACFIVYFGYTYMDKETKRHEAKIKQLQNERKGLINKL